MGNEARRKQYNRNQFLQAHPYCAYCGAPAVTTDHCPPRCFFRNRKWPEGYEFPACEACNAEARLDEQTLAVLTRIDKSAQIEDQSSLDPEWVSLVDGLRNNQPEVYAEWMELSGPARKRAFRKVFGSNAHIRQAEGWGVANLGPLTQAAISRFMVKLGKALFYLHNEAIFEGVIFARHFNMLAENDSKTLLNTLLEFAPGLSLTQRANKNLSDQFVYRYNNSLEFNVLYAIASFGTQFLFQIMAYDFEMEKRIIDSFDGQGPPLPLRFLFRCPLKHRP